MSWRLKNAVTGLPRLTLFGRSVLLLAAELLANAVCWIVCGILFGRRAETRSILSLALLAWTIGLRHALDADHISAIDNATRSLINMGQLPVTCGLFFSLGHSTIVIVVNVAIAISTDVYNHIDGVGAVGGIVGAAVSASFLFIVGLANSIILFRVLRKRRRVSRTRTGETAEDAGADEDEDLKESHGNTLMMKIIGPVVTFVDRPWKMYPVGVLFGFGFDTASSIALLAISAIAQRQPDGRQIAPGDIVVLPLLFTVGMTLIDSIDSIIMLYSYAGFPERGFALLEPRTRAPTFPRTRTPPEAGPERNKSQVDVAEVVRADVDVKDPLEQDPEKVGTVDAVDARADINEPVHQRTLRVKHNAVSNLSILLTLMSIMVAFSISLITVMGLIGDNCAPCQKAANAEDGGGLAGRWWRGWANANDKSGYIGAAIVGSFIAVVLGWYGARFLYRKWQTRRGRAATKTEQ
ncbi:NicO-domain-containing protein [Trametes versicolor FP-101664 SS1]|uniref:NicO-domain-containing protein n=1 Tax=Trametes versicolor (strain FP-101664) TaxID=717944 RepID=UPI00046222B5|nr:NicO-domain-containing protein [Trametes versicolor FP-101664 SS1]EIW59722.1 NicO-domain-containing protein [Trametes versicolor FP-101664 SS1]